MTHPEFKVGSTYQTRDGTATYKLTDLDYTFTSGGTKFLRSNGIVWYPNGRMLGRDGVHLTDHDKDLVREVQEILLVPEPPKPVLVTTFFVGRLGSSLDQIVMIGEGYDTEDKAEYHLKKLTRDNVNYNYVIIPVTALMPPRKS